MNYFIQEMSGWFYIGIRLNDGDVVYLKNNWKLICFRKYIQAKNYIETI